MTRNKFKVAPFDRTGKLTTTLYLFTGVSWVVLSFLFAPRGYLVSREGIVIRRAVGSFTIPAAEVESVELVGRVRPGIRL